jgi:Curli assembly protein CsgE
MKSILCGLIIISGLELYCSGVLYAASEPSSLKYRRSVQDINSGLVVDQSITFIGQNFYRAFVQRWMDVDTEGRYAIVIKEYPSPKSGTYVHVEYSGVVMFSASLSPTSNNTIPIIASGAVQQVYQNLVSVESENPLILNSDLGSN